MNFITANVKTNTGTTMMQMMAPILPHCNPSSARAIDATTGSGAAFELVSGKARTRSFQARIKQNREVAAIPGAVNGNMMMKKVANLPHPSMLAASSNSSGKSMKKLRIIQVANGILSARYGKIKPICVSSRPVLL